MATWPVYGTLAEHDAYHAAHGNPSEWTTSTDAEKVSALREASEYLDLSYTWGGRRTERTQVRDFPRTGLYDRDGYSVVGIPQAVKDATSYLALAVRKGDVLMPDIDAGAVEGDIRRQRSKIEGLEEEIEYVAGATQSIGKRFPKVDRMLRNAGLLDSAWRIERG